MKDSYQFAGDFQWGVATAAYQIEGAADEDGRKPSVWDTLSRRAGGTRTGDSGDVACDHYHRYREDFALMASLGIKHYRFSISWPRILPDGVGAVNQKGLDFYHRLVDCMMEHGITPHATLFHWDSPQALEEKYGSWDSRQMAYDFADYSAVVVKSLGDKITNWMTINEIPCFTVLASNVGSAGVHAPSKPAKTQKEIYQKVYHAVLGHGLSVQAIRANTPVACRVSLVDNTAIAVPVKDSEKDIEAAKKAFRNLWVNGLVAFPALTGKFSEEFVAEKTAKGEMPDVTEGDLKIMSEPIDGFGLNTYSGVYFKHAENEAGFEEIPFSEHHPRLDMPWLNFVPDSIYWGIRHVSEEAGFKGNLFISENGCANKDTITPKGEVLDPERIVYLKSYLRQLHRAYEEGYRVTGYFQWSFLDNFEWMWGYSKRFGIVYTNYQTQERIPKESARWYAECIRQGRVV